MNNKLWKSGDKKWAYFFTGLFFLIVSMNGLYRNVNVIDGFFFCTALVLMTTSGVSIRKSVMYEDRVSFAISKRKFVHLVENVVNTVPAEKELTGFLIGKKYYPVDCEDGSYTVERYPYDDKVTFYTYRFADSDMDMLVVKDSRREVSDGGVMVYKR